MYKDFDLKMNSYVNKITKSINDFNLNVVVANVYEIYKGGINAEIFTNFLIDKLFTSLNNVKHYIIMETLWMQQKQAAEY